MNVEMFDKILSVLNLPHTKGSPWYNTVKESISKLIAAETQPSERTFTLAEMIECFKWAMVEGAGQELTTEQAISEYLKHKFGIEI